LHEQFISKGGSKIRNSIKDIVSRIRGYNRKLQFNALGLKGKITIAFTKNIILEDKEAIEYFQEHFARVRRELISLISNEKMRQDYLIILTNSALRDTYSPFLNFSYVAFTHEVVNGISRLCDHQFEDKDKKIYSLQALLKEFEQYSHLLSRARYTGNLPTKSKGSSARDSMALNKEDKAKHQWNRLNREYDSLVGGGYDYLPNSTIKKDIKAITKVSSQIKRYRNKFVAHNAADRKEGEQFQEGDILKSIAELTRLVKKYLLLFECAAYYADSHNNSITRLFDKAWISENEQYRKITKLIEENKIRIRNLTDMDWT
jgi:hypothetical protein